MKVRAEPVAVVGASAVFPEAPTLDDLHRNLLAGRDSVRPVGRERLVATSMDPDADYPEIGYLDRIDLFDPAFFAISLREAEYMDPHQRLLLQLCYSALEDSGHAPGSLRGGRTAVLLAAPRTDYQRLIPVPDPLDLLGTDPSALPGRIAYALDLQGPAVCVDSGCASSLVAVHDACRILRVGECDLAIAGGLSVASVLSPRTDDNPYGEILSADGRCKAFDASADGAGIGEGGGVVVCKLLRDALADGDRILAVIRGSAVNQNGFRSNGLSAPSPGAQTDLLLDAWARAGIGAAELSYVEAHGSGTRLGDVIEAQGLNGALDSHGITTPTVPVGSIKTNIGHLDPAAGVAGLFKALLTVRHRTVYPSLHFHRPNPLIDFDSSGFRVATEPETVEGPVTAGVSSFSLAGTNVHVVLSEPPPAPASPSVDGRHVVTVSARTPASFARRVSDLSGADAALPDLAATVARGRDHFALRRAVVVSDTRELSHALEGLEPVKAGRTDRSLVVLVSGDAELGEERTEELSDAFPAFAEARREFAKHANGVVSPGVALLRSHWCLHSLLRSMGLTPATLVGSGPGNLAVRAVQGKLDLADAVAQAASEPPSPDLDRDRLAAAVDRLGRDAAVWLELASGVLGRTVTDLGLRVVSLADDPLAAVAALYESGVEVDWETHHPPRPHVELPTYPFDTRRVWCLPEGTVWTPDSPSRPPLIEPVRIPEGDTVQRLAAIWTDALKADDVGPDDDYFALGGTSITAMAVLDSIERSFGVRLSFADLYEHHVLGDLASYLETHHTTDDAPPIVAVARTERMELSYGQEQIWFLDRLEPDSPLYNIPMDLHLPGSLDADALREALRDLARRHEILRARFPADEAGRPYAVVEPEPPVDMPVTDLSHLPTEQRRDEALRLWNSEATTPFDLATGPLIRTQLVRLAPDDHVLFLTVHHIVYDGWTPFVIHTEMSELYRARVEGREHGLPPLDVQYLDYAAWQREWMSGQTLDRALGFWREHLNNAPTLDLPTDRPRPPMQDFTGHMLEFTIPAELGRRLRELSRAEGVTMFATMLAAVNVLMHRWTGADDIVIGSPTSGRRREATRQLIGYFNNMMPLRTDLRGDPTFRELIRREGAVVAAGLDNDEVPLEKIVSALNVARDPSRHPFFDVTYSHQNAPITAYDMPDVTHGGWFGGGAIRGIAPGTSKFDLTIGVADQDEGDLEGYFEYMTALFDEATMRRMMEQFLVLLQAASSDPDSRLSELDLLPPAELHAVLHGFNDTATSVPDPRLVHELVAARAAERPDSVAVADARATLTYRELDERANALALRLVDAGVAPDRLVAILLERGVDMAVAVLATAKAGGAFFWIESSHPQARIAAMLDDADAACVVTSDALRQLVPAGTDVVEVAGDREARPPDVAVAPDNLAYVIYTSGSTGTPKGVQVTPANLRNLVWWQIRTFDVTHSDRASQVAGLGFDASVWEFWPYLCAGAELHLPDEATRTDPVALVRWWTERRITCAFAPTPVTEALLAADHWPEDISLRWLFCGGDKLTRRPPPGLGFGVADMYGPSECAVISSSAVIVPEPADTIPDIGTPVSNARVYILDGTHRPCPIGVWGELCIAGDGVGRGYRNRPDLTAERFVPDPYGPPGSRLYRTGDLARWTAEGRLVFGGRFDDQVKVRAYRIELGEIETVLSSHPGVRECVVLARPGAGGAKRIVAYAVGRTGAVADADVRSHLAERLPDYMLPAEVVWLDAIPLTPNGKVDRDALPDTDRRGAQRRVSPDRRGDATLETLRAIWAEVLGTEEVDPHDNFFDLGGDSILSIQIVAKAARAGLRITPRQMFQHQTCVELARVAETAGRSDVPAAVPDLGESYPLTPAQRGIAFESLLARGSGVYVEQVVTPVRGDLDTDALSAAWRAVAAGHEILRTAVRWNDEGEPLQVVHPAVDVAMSRHDWRGEADPHARLAAFCDADRRLGFDLGSAPLWRVAVVRMSDGEHRVVWTHHHVLLDGWSAAIVLDEMWEAYAALVSGDEPRLLERTPFRELVSYMRAQDADDGWWTSLLAGAEPTPLPGPDPDGEPGRIEARLELDEETTSTLEEYARSARLTLNSVVTGAWVLTLARCAQRPEALIGVTLAGRPPQLAGAEGIVGLCINTLPLRVGVDEHADVQEWLSTVQDATMELSAREHADLGRLHRLAGAGVLFDTVFAFESFPQEAVGTGRRLPGLEVGEPDTVDHTNYALALSAGPGERIELSVHADAASIDRATLGSCLDSLAEVLRSLPAAHRVSDLPGPPPELLSHRRPRPAPAVRPHDGEPARTASERTLAGVWREVLGVADVGRDDAFLDLGGDSVLAMQVVVRAARSGLHVTPRQIIEGRTLAAVAAQAVAVGEGSRAERVDHGPVSLLPVQRWLLASEPAEVDHFNMSLVCEVPAGADASALRRAVDAVVARHAALRLRVRRNAFGWQGEIAVEETADVFASVDLSSVDDADAALRDHAERVQRSLDIRHGPVVRVVGFDLGPHRPARLLVVVHHLACDAVSWAVLLGDLAEAYRRISMGLPADLDPPPVSVGDWANRLVAHSGSDELAAEIKTWEAALSDADPRLPCDHPDAPDTDRDAASIVVSVDAHETAEALRAAAETYRARPNEVVAAAVALAVSRWTGNAGAFLDFEGHGRDAPDGADLSRTVGWLTALYPLWIPASGPSDALIEAKERMRAVPHGGLGFGVLTQMSPATAAVEGLRSAPRPPIAFNFVGSWESSLGTGGFLRPLDITAGAERSPRSIRTHPISVDSQIREGILEFEIGFGARHDRSTIDGLAEGVVAALRDIAEHCRSLPEPVPTPSDFPLAGLDRAQLDSLLRSCPDATDAYPLSPLQHGMLFHSLLDASRGAYVEQVVIRLDGALDPQALRESWREVTARHPVLRTSVVWEGVPTPLQVVRERAVPAWDSHDLRGTDGASQQRWLDEMLAADRARGFDFSVAPLQRFALVRISDESCWMVWTHHHLLLDGWSAAIVVADVFETYEAKVAGREHRAEAARRHFRDYIAWVRDRSRSEGEAYWRRVLSGFPAATPLPVGRADPRRGQGTTEVDLTLAETRALEDFARSNRLTPSTVLVGAWALMLGRHASTDDVVCGITVSGRPHELAGVEEMVGLFINTLPMRFQLEEGAEVSAWLAGVQDQRLELGRHEHWSLTDVAALSDVAAPTDVGAGRPLFESIFVYENYPTAGAALPTDTIKLSLHAAVEHVDFPLLLVAAPGESLRLRVYNDRSRIDDATVGRLLDQLRTLLASIASAPAARLSDLEVLPAPERSLLDRFAAGEPTDARTTIVDLFASHVERTPGAVAVVCGDEQLTYAELDSRANRLAHLLRESGVEAGDVVAVSGERGIDTVVAHLAVAKAGASYLPLDAAAPPARREFMLSESGASVVVGETVTGTDADAMPEEAPKRRPHPDSLAYVMYTSGSTGQPKGVAVTHANVARLVRGLGGWDLSGRVLHLAPESFDASTLEVWGPLCNGGTVVVHPPGPLAIEELAATLARHRVDTVWLTSSLYNTVVDEAPDIFAPVRQLVVGGETLSPHHVRRCLELHPGVRFFNGYGPTETTTFAAVHHVTDASGPIPIGRPIGGTTVRVVDARGDLCPFGSWGEILIGGDGVARGYRARPDLTAAAFVPDPWGPPGSRAYRTGDLGRWTPEGLLEFGGRIDGQVKLRGHRVECGEIEAALVDQSGVEAAVVVAHGEGATRKLVAYVVGEADVDPLADRLPAYMIPTTFVAIDVLPLTPNGKVDRSALPEPSAHRAAQPGEPPSTPTEQLLASVWCDVLGVREVAITDSFFDLGGHSLLATQVTSRIRETFGAGVDLRAVFEAPDLRSLAAVVAEAAGGAEAADGIAETVLELGRMSDAEVERMLASMESSCD